MWKGINTTIAILAICALELVALKMGVNGIMLAGAVGAIAGLGGFVTGKKTSQNNATKKKK